MTHEVEVTMFNALSVIVQTPEIRAWMIRNDPQAYMQAQDALDFGRLSRHDRTIRDGHFDLTHESANVMNRAWDVRENFGG